MTKKKSGRPLGRPKVNSSDIPRNELILQTAARLFIENGFQKVSIDDVAKDANVTKATVYYYFESKAELYKESIISLMTRINKTIDNFMSTNKSLYNRLFDVTIAHLQATATLDLESFMREMKTELSDEQIQEMKIAEENMYKSIEQALLTAIDTGEIPKINIKFATQSYLALIKVGNYKLPNGTPIFQTTQESAENILNVFWKGFIDTNIGA
ncbi:TetR/AcrR family transcriptional regulator [Heyndrickxia sp. NPDC080065]|uniref:TetR/AcrR family transcriptional regulator n=1 Tax=Heyndrickxia sp. NPDC080065 TaxID=3390568 RepID=UPI003D03B826